MIEATFTERLKLHSPYSQNIVIMVGGKITFIIGDLELYLQGHGIDLGPGPWGYVPL